MRNIVEMYDKMVRDGLIVPSPVEPSAWMAPTAYFSVPTSTVFVTPPVGGVSTEEAQNAKLGSRSKRDSKGKKRPKR